MENATNNGYTRCHNCHTVYESSKQSCPDCGTPNVQKIDEMKNVSESFEPVFNIID